MPTPAASLITVLDGVVLGLVLLASLHSLHRLWLLAAVWWQGRRPAPPTPTALGSELAFVTVQVPLFNERDVAARVVAACAALAWPRDRYEVQVLDDSTDDTRLIVDAAAAEARARGVSVSVLRRAHRAGFKAGALAEGVREARGELLAIFDADFLPDRDFLRRVVPHFADAQVGMVQARWGHLNADESVLTQAQATLLDGHFKLDHAARAALACWFNFNGTAGVWRRACIEAAGGWQGDTLTEDLDLSYRAQLAGWRFAYAADIVVPAEVPSTMAAFRAQQRRWAIGSIQTLRKLAGRVLRAPVSLRVRAEALAHLGANLSWLPALGLAICLPWAVLAGGRGADGVVAGLSLALCTVPNVLFYRVAAGGWAGVPGAVLLALGLVSSQARATLTGLRGTREAFARTPKRGASEGSSYVAALPALGWAELFLSLPHFAAAVRAGERGEWGTVPFLLMFGTALLWVATGWRGQPLRASSREVEVVEPNALTGEP
jgi:hypothetical protein